MIILDVEIEKGILMPHESPREGIEYCKGWRDFAGMGVSTACTLDLKSGLSRTFDKERLNELDDYLAGKETGGFNTKRFDIPLLKYHGVTRIDIDQHYDALEKIWLKLKLDPDQFDELHKGWGLDAVMRETFGLSKTGHGAMAPVWWQQGKHSKVIDYCLNDVWLEGKLIKHMLDGGIVKALGKDPLSFAAPKPVPTPQAPKQRGGMAI